MTEVKEAEGSLFDLFQWSFLQNMSILNDNTTTLQDVEQMVKLFQGTVETELKYITDPKKQMDILDAHIDKQAKWLAVRQYAIMLLDGQAKNFQEDINEKTETLYMMGTPFPQPILDLYDYLKKETAIKVRLEFDEETKRGLLSVSSPDAMKKMNYLGLAKAFIGLRFSLGKWDMDLPKELPNYFNFSTSSLVYAILSKQQKKAIAILFRPLLLIQAKRMFWAYLNERKLAIMANPKAISHETAPLLIDVFATKLSDNTPEVAQIYEAIKGNLSDNEICRFFEFLYKEKSKNGQCFLTQTEVNALLANGFSLPQNTSPVTQFTINMTEHEYWVIYACFYGLWKKHSFVKNGGKEDYAKFLKTHFTNYEKTDLKTIQNSIQTALPSKMPFNINNYLPKNN